MYRFESTYRLKEVRQNICLWVAHVQATRRKADVVVGVRDSIPKWLQSHIPLLAPRLEFTSQDLALADTPVFFLEYNRLKTISGAGRAKVHRYLERTNVLSECLVAVDNELAIVSNTWLSRKEVVVRAGRIHIQGLGEIVVKDYRAFDQVGCHANHDARHDGRCGNHVFLLE